MLSVQVLMQEAQVARPTGPRRRANVRDERRKIDEAIGSLPELQRLVLALRYYESIRPRQIGRVLGITEEEVRSVLCQAVRSVLEGSADAAALEKPPRRSRAVVPDAGKRTGAVPHPGRARKARS